MTTGVAPADPTLPQSSPATLPDRQQTVVLHDGGDVVLVVGEAGGIQQPIQASKTAMSMASPVWKAMFSHVWAEHEASEISLPDDDVEAMLLVLRIAHLRFQDLPNKDPLSLNSLLNLAVVCDKYDLVHLVRPFLDLYGWAKPASTVYTLNTDPVWLFIDWTFGYSGDFTFRAKYFAANMSMGPDGVPVVAGQPFPKYMPPGLLDKITEIRLGALRSILDVCYENLNQALHGKICKQTPPSETECRCMIVGSYILFLSANNLYPQRPQAESLTMSVQSFSNLFSNLEIRTHESHDYSALSDRARIVQSQRSIYSSQVISRQDFVGSGITEHRACGEVIDVAARAKQICSQRPSPVLEEHRVHMAAQAAK